PEAAPGLGIGRVNLDRFSEGDRGFVHLPLASGFYARPHEGRRALADGHCRRRGRGRHKGRKQGRRRRTGCGPCGTVGTEHDCHREATHHHQNNQSPSDTPLPPGLSAFAQPWDTTEARPAQPLVVHAHQNVRQTAHWVPPSTMVGLNRPPTTRDNAMAIRGPTIPSSCNPPTARWKRRTATWKRPS